MAVIAVFHVLMRRSVGFGTLFMLLMACRIRCDAMSTGLLFSVCGGMVAEAWLQRVGWSLSYSSRWRNFLALEMLFVLLLLFFIGCCSYGPSFAMLIRIGWWPKVGRVIIWAVMLSSGEARMISMALGCVVQDIWCVGINLLMLFIGLAMMRLSFRRLARVRCLRLVIDLAFLFGSLMKLLYFLSLMLVLKSPVMMIGVLMFLMWLMRVVSSYCSFVWPR